ncbi:MAG: OmpH family outer membrane protein [Emcibacteraceae bacterium]|nr:OmpH family outer membrane protein [Emcibacteraceae bacterium]
MTKIINIKNVFAAVIAVCSITIMNNVAYSQEIPVAKIIVVDNKIISTNSAVAIDINRQVRQIESQMQVELQTRRNALQAEQEDIQSKVNIMPQESWNQLQQAFQLKVNQYQQDVQIKGVQLDRAIANANAELARALKPILQNVLQQKGATMMMDKTLIIEQVPGLDVTTMIMEQLDLALPSVEVVLPDLPEAAPVADATPTTN